MATPGPKNQALSIEGQNIANLAARVTALETTDADVATTTVFNKRLGGRSKLATHLENLNKRVVALEIDSTAAVDFDTHLPRSPLGTALYNLHKRLVALGG